MVDWYEREREYIKNIATLRNIEIIKKNEPKRSYIPIVEYKAIKESSKYVIEAFKENLRHMEDMNKGFVDYKFKYENAEQRIEDTIKSSCKYSKGIFGSRGSYYIQENEMYKITNALLTQFLWKDYELFKDKAEKLISSFDFDEDKLMQNLVDNKNLFKELNKLDLENKRLKQIEKKYNLLKSELDFLKDHIEKTTEEKYKNELEKTKEDLSLYKKAYINSNSEKEDLLNLFNKYELGKVIEEKQKNKFKNKIKDIEIDM